MPFWLSRLKAFLSRRTHKPVKEPLSFEAVLADRKREAERMTQCILERIEGGGRRISDRTLRLLLCAHLRLQRWDSLAAECRSAVLVAERLADGRADEAERRAALQAAETVCTEEIASYHNYYPDSLHFVDPDAVEAAELALATLGDAKAAARFCISVNSGWQRAASFHYLFEEICGRPSGNSRVDGSWLAGNSGASLRLAQAIYEEGRWNELPVLADALEDAGCDSAEILNHLRSAGPHVRGCWALDAVLGME
jgi:hypothetical protein